MTLALALAASSLFAALLPGGSEAAQDRTHSFATVFTPTGEGALSRPGPLALNDTTGELFVIDSGHERVVRFTPDGKGSYQFASAFKVNSPGAIAVDNSTSTSDPSKGDIYVSGASEAGAEALERDFIYKFSPAGEKLMKKSIFKGKEEGESAELELENIQGLAVDSSGNLWVYWEEEGHISALSDAQPNRWIPSDTPKGFEGEQLLTEGCSARPVFGVASDDSAFYVGYERPDSEEDCPGEEELTPDPIAVAVLEGQDMGLASREVERHGATALALSPREGQAAEQLYLTSAQSIGAFSAEGLLIQRFGEETLQEADAQGAAISPEDASGPGAGDLFVSDAKNNRIDIFAPSSAGAPQVDALSAHSLTPSSEELSGQVDPNGSETEYHFLYGSADCATEPAACTSVPIPAGHLLAGFGDHSVRAEVSGLAPASAYYYELVATGPGGSASAVPQPNTFTTLPSPTVLPDNRAWEIVSPPDKHDAGVEGLPHEGGAMIEAAAQGNAISWVANGPLASEPEGNRNPEPTQLLSTRSEGRWQTQSLETPHTRGGGLEEVHPIGVEYQAFSPDLSLSLLTPAAPQVEGGLGAVETPPLSPDASEKTIYLRDDPPLEPGPGERTAYEQASAAENESYLSPGYLPLVTAANDGANARFGGGLDYVGATEDLSHVIFSSAVGLTAQAPSAAGLYEWSEGQPLSLVSVLPNHEAATDPFLGAGEGSSSIPGLNTRDAVSANGERVIFTDGREHLYLRDTQSNETIGLSAAQGHEATEVGPGGHEVSEPPDERQEVRFQGASANGQKIFFTDTASLTEEDGELQPIGGEEGPADLYEFALTSVPGEPLKGKLTDLTPEAAEGNAEVLNLLPGISEDGAYLYFVANGVLAPGASPGHCARYYGEEQRPAPGSKCNLYVSEPDPTQPGMRETRFIASLSSEDAADWGAGLDSNLIPEADLSAVSSRVSPNGRFFAFMSQESLTGYDNEDQTSKAAGEKLDEEVFLYDAETDRLICASCNPSGARPAGVFDTLDAGEGLGLLVDRPENWLDHWLAASLPDWMLDYGKEKSAGYQARYLSNEGRLFFNSADGLVPQDKNGKEDVYEYEPQGEGGCADSGGCVGLISSGTSSHEAAFLDASESGDDVFFMSAAPLVAADEDEAYDVYDARVCTPSSPCLTYPAGPPHSCESEVSCHGQAQAPVPAAPAPATQLSPTGSEVPSAATLAAAKRSAPAPRPLTRAERLARALRSCRKLKNRHRRTACEREARQRYRPRRNANKAHAKRRPHAGGKRERKR
ncbi:MAG TPA: hypothetical protein VMB51_09560 [Solirubrobacteraceae bacterium]|nr:hypothetical protein [Solirubrobacteraceae bacterium]